MKTVTGPDAANGGARLQLYTAADKAVAIVRSIAPPSFVKLVLRVALAVPFWTGRTIDRRIRLERGRRRRLESHTDREEADDELDEESHGRHRIMQASRD